MIGVPIHLLHQSQNHVVSIELKTGQIYRGYLVEAEDTMNCKMQDVDVTSRDGKLYDLNQVYLRGSQIRYIVIPDMLARSPIIERVNNQSKRGKAGTTTMKSKISAPPKKQNLRPPNY